MMQVELPRELSRTLIALRRRKPWQKSRNPRCISIETCKIRPQIALFAEDRGNVNRDEQGCHHSNQPPTARSGREPQRNRHRPKVERIARIRIWSRCRKFRILADIASRIPAQPKPRQDQQQTYCQCSCCGLCPPQVDGGDRKSHRNPNPLHQLLPHRSFSHSRSLRFDLSPRAAIQTPLQPLRLL